MTTIDTHATGTAVPSGTAGSVATSSTPGALGGLVGWLTTTDHKRIGRLFIGCSLLVAIGVAVLGALVGVGRVSQTRHIISAHIAPQLFAAFRFGLIFGVLVPVLVGLAIAVVPLQLGARSLAFPRLAAAGLWTWLVGMILVVITLAANGGPNGGDRRMVEGFLVAHVLVVLGLFAAAVSLVTSILTTRAPGMNMRRVPPFSFASLVMGLVVLLGLPVVLGALIYSIVDYRAGGAAFGGSKQLWDHIGFGSTQPFTFALAVPALGVLIDTAATSSGKRLPMRGTVFAGFGLVGLGVLGAIIQFPAGLRRNIFHSSFGTFLNDAVPYAFFQLLPILGGLIVLGIGGLALAKGRAKVSAGLVFGLLGVLMVFAGMLANAVFYVGDAQLGGTVFEEGTRVLVAYGAILALLGGVAYWGPKLWGRTMSDKVVIPLALLGFAATALAGMPYLIAGFAKQPADLIEFKYGGPQELWNGVSVAGHLLMAIVVLGFVAAAFASFTSDADDRQAGDDPWDGQTLEWTTSSPAPEANFADVPMISSAEPLLDVKQAAGRTA